MTHLHEKSPCCQGFVRRFGGRRRQCVVCKKTWSVWRRKQGRKRRRTNGPVLLRYFFGRYAPKTPTERARLRITLKKFLATTPWPEIPSDPLIAVADGMLEYINKEMHTIYFILLRPIDGIKAVITEPLCIPGRETPDGWRQAFARLTPEVREQIVSLTCDGHRAFLGITDQYGWILQRCHFHLFASIGNYASFGPMNKTHDLGRRLLRLVRVIVTTKDPERLRLSILYLKKYRKLLQSRGLKTVISGFLRCYWDFRAYIDHPHLNIPITSNSVEHLIGCLRRLQYKARGFSSLPALMGWITGWCKYQKTITCRGKNQQN